MKTLILYATKNGATREIATRISQHISGATLHDLKQPNIPALATFDCVIVGSAIYAGAMRKEAKSFLAQHTNDLRGKPLGLFVSGMVQGDETRCFKDNVSASLLQSAKATRFLGGIFDPQTSGAVARLLMKAVTKQSGYVNTICDEQIKQFVAQMNL